MYGLRNTTDNPLMSALRGVKEGLKAIAENPVPPRGGLRKTQAPG